MAIQLTGQRAGEMEAFVIAQGGRFVCYPNGNGGWEVKGKSCRALLNELKEQFGAVVCYGDPHSQGVASLTDE